MKASKTDEKHVMVYGAQYVSLMLSPKDAIVLRVRRARRLKSP